MQRRRPKTALVLAGGGARGAYEAGVLRYLRGPLAKHLGYQPPIDLISGTSVGGINACFLAATADQPARQADVLCQMWRSLHLEELISLSARDLLKAGRLLMGAEPPAPKPGAYRYGGVLDTTGLESFVLSSIPWANMRKNFQAGTIEALAIAATQVATGISVVFIDSAKAIPRSSSHNPLVVHKNAAIGPRHALASAAIPLLFPAVRVGRRFYVDGGLRLNTPLSPALRLGAERLLMVSLRHVEPPHVVATALESERETAYPKPLFLAGKALNAMLLDAADADIERMQHINEILAAGRRAYGDEFGDRINDQLASVDAPRMRETEAVHVRPSRDIGQLASDLVRSGGVVLKARVARRLLDRMVSSEAAHENDLLSYLLFDGEYAAALIDMGYADARDNEEALARLFRRD